MTENIASKSIVSKSPALATRHGPKPPKTAKGRQTREAILAALQRVLNSQGYYGTTIGQVVTEAGVPTGSFYRYFAGKPEATLELVERLLASYVAAIPLVHDLQSFWERELMLHSLHVRLYESDRGLLGCYFTYDTSIPAFALTFWEYTKRFLDAHILALAAVRPGCDLPVAMLRPSLLALVSMSENMIFRHFMGRDPDLNLSDERLVHVMLRLRYRAIFLLDPPLTDDGMDSPEADLSGSIEGFDFEPSGRRRDSQATLDRMRQATLTLLDTTGYEELRLADIEEASGLTRGAIYHHFRDKRELVLSIISGRLREISLALEQVEVNEDAYRSLHALVAVFVDAFSASRALMKTLYHLEEVDGEFGAYYQNVRRSWAAALARKIEALAGPTRPARRDVVALAFLAMTDRFLYDVYSLRYDEFADLRDNPDDASHLLALLWHRSLFLKNPASGFYPALKPIAGGPQPA